MPTIHPLSVVDPKAEIADDVIIGPFCYVESGVTIDSGCKLDSHVTIKGNTKLGKDNYVGQGTVLGGDPQDRKYSGEPTYLVIGDRNVFREYITIHRATGEGKTTVVGNDCFMMAYCHIGHNGTVHDFVTIANCCAMAGHVTIEERVTIGGYCVVHQFARIGKGAMVGGWTPVSRDIPPFMLVSGQNQEVRDINAVGLRRLGLNSTVRLGLHKACKLLFKSQLGMTNAIETVRREVPTSPELEYLLQYQERIFRGKNGRGDQP